MAPAWPPRRSARSAASRTPSTRWPTASRPRRRARGAGLDPQEQAAELEEQGESLAQVNAVLAGEQAATERFFRFGQRLVEDANLRRLAERLVADMAAMARADVGTVHGRTRPHHRPIRSSWPRSASIPLGSASASPPGVGPGGRALAEQLPVVLTHADTGLGVRVMAGTAALRHELHLPLVVLGRPLGVVALGRVRDEPFAEDDVDLLGTLAEQAAVVVSHAGALAEARRHATIISATLRANVDGIALFDGDGRNVLLNDSAAEIYTEMLGRDARATFAHHGLFIDADLIASRVLDPASFLDGLAQARATSMTEAVTAEFTMRESGRSFRRHAMPVEDDEGQELGRLFILRELTLERQAERFKDELIATVSHELRTPLTSIVGYAEMLEEPNLAPEETSHFAATIRRQGVRLTALVDDLLDLQQIGSGAFRLERRAVDLAGRLTEQAELFRAQSRSHRINLVLGDPELGVMADERTVDQVVANLLSNAVKYSPDGGEVTIRALRGDGVVRVSVSDQGIGIPEAEHGRVFSQFFRAEAVVGSQIRGTGLGLALVREMIEPTTGGSASTARSASARRSGSRSRPPPSSIGPPTRPPDGHWGAGRPRSARRPRSAGRPSSCGGSARSRARRRRRRSRTDRSHRGSPGTARGRSC
jgi:signal transduction histidine kinase